jgi:hypothetical protein
MRLRKWCTEDFRCGFCCLVQLSIPINKSFSKKNCSDSRRMRAGLQGEPIVEDVCEISIVVFT